MPTDPDSVTTKKAHGILAEQGSWLKGTLAVNRQPGRVDVLYSVDQPDSFSAMDSLLPNAGGFEEVLTACAGFAEPLSRLEASRIAFGAVLFLPVEASEEGYEYLKKFLPFMKFEEDMSDFFLQVNRKKSSALGIQVNELSKWGCVDVRGFNVIDPEVQTPQFFAVRLEIDVNTPDSPTPINVDVAKLIVELMSRGRSIAQDGAV